MKTNLSSASRKTDHAFTLLELLVATSVLSLLMVLLFQIFVNATKAWALAEKKVDAFREARASLNIMAQDLQTAVVTSNLQMAVCLNRSDNLPPLSSEARGSSLFFSTGSSLRSQQSSDYGNLCVVGYYCAFTPDNAGAGVGAGNLVRNSFKLYRYFLTSSSVYSTYLNKLIWTSTTLTPSVATSEVLGRNIYNFSISYYTNATAQTATASLTNLVQLDLTLDGVNYDTATKLKDENDWTSLSTSTLGLQNRQTFRRTILLPQWSPDSSPR